MLSVGIIKDEHILVSHLYRTHPLGANQQMIDQLVRSAFIGRGRPLNDGTKPPVIRLTRSMSVVGLPLADFVLYGVISGNEDVVASQSLLGRIGLVLASVVNEHPDDMLYVLKHCLEAIVDFGCPQTTDIDQLRNSLETSLPSSAKPYRKNELFVDVLEDLEVELSTKASSPTGPDAPNAESAIGSWLVAGQTTGRVSSSARLNMTSMCQLKWQAERPLRWLGHPDNVMAIDGSEISFIPTKDPMDVLTYVVDMNYKHDEIANLPFLLELVTLELRGVTITLELRIVSRYSKSVQCNDAKVYFPLPLNTANANVTEGRAVYEQLQNRICWNVGRMSGGDAENRLCAVITTYRPLTAFHGSAQLSFSLANKACLRITHLRLQNELFRTPPILWVKYQTSGRYTLKFQHTSTL